ncbi:MAG: Holliday junction resolvase RuvX [Veillonellaceae bacterium]|nr:Holliday junction resolvase RuvX [Veillonellaceae bacterium]
MKRVLGLDIGTKRIGIAVSDPLGWTAQGVETWQHVSRAADFDRIAHWVATYEAATVVIGMPRNMDGSKGPKALWTEEYAALLQERLPETEIVFWDERLSTVMAERSLLAADVSRSKRRKVIDKLAATVILQGYLDARS